MPIFEVQTPDGRRFQIEGETEPTEAQLSELVGPAPAEEGDFLKSAGEFVKRQLMMSPPVAAATGLGVGSWRISDKLALGAGKGLLRDLAPGAFRAAGAVMELLPPVSTGPGMAYVPPALVEEQMRRVKRTPYELAKETAEHPLVKAADVAEQYWKEKIPTTEEEEKTFRFGAGEQGTGLAWYGLMGKAGSAYIGAESYAAHILNDVERIKKENPEFTDEDAGRLAFANALASGTIQATIFAALPPNLRKIGAKFIMEKLGRGAMEQFIGKRIASAAEVGTLMATARIPENVLSGRPIMEGVLKSGAGGGGIGLLMPYRWSPKDRPPRPPMLPEALAARKKLVDQKLKETGFEYNLRDDAIESDPLKVAHAPEQGPLEVSMPRFNYMVEKYLGEGWSVDEAIQKVIDHEVYHKATWLLPGGGEKAKEFWNDFTWLEQKMFRNIIPNSKGKSDTTLGHEAIRFMMERAATGTPSEFIMFAKNSGIGTKTLTNLLGLTMWIRRNLGATKASERQLKLLDQVDNNVKEARASAMKGYADASEEQTTAAVHGDVRTREESAQPLSVAEGGEGVRKEAEGRVEEKPEEEVLLKETEKPKKKELPASGTPDEGVRFGKQEPLDNEIILESAFVADDGTIYYGPHHPSALEKAGVSGFENRESRNTPRFGYRTNKRPFVSRELGGKIAQIYGGDLRVFDEPIHSDQTKSAIQPGVTVAQQKDLGTSPFRTKPVKVEVPPTEKPVGGPPAAPAEVAAKPGVAAPVEPAIAEGKTVGPPAQVAGPARRAYQAHLDAMRKGTPSREQLSTMRRLLRAAEKEDAETKRLTEGSDVEAPAMEIDEKKAIAAELNGEYRGTMVGRDQYHFWIDPKHYELVSVPEGSGRGAIEKKIAESRERFAGESPSMEISEEAERLLKRVPPTIRGERVISMEMADGSKAIASWNPELVYDLREPGKQYTPKEIEDQYLIRPSVGFFKWGGEWSHGIKDKGDKIIEDGGRSAAEWMVRNKAPGMEMPAEQVWEETRKSYAEATGNVDVLKARLAATLGDEIATKALEKKAPAGSNEAKFLAEKSGELTRQREEIQAQFRTAMAEQVKSAHQLRMLDPKQTKTIDAIVQKMVPEGLTYSKRDIEQCAAYVLSLPKSEREAALNRFEEAMKRAEESRVEQATKGTELEGRRAFQQIKATPAELRLGCINYLRMGIRPVSPDKPKRLKKGETAPTAPQAPIPTGKVDKEGRPILKFPTAEEGWKAVETRYTVPTFDGWAKMVLGPYAGKNIYAKEQLRPIWDEVVGEFLHGASKETLEKLRIGFKLGRRYGGEISEPATDPIVWEMIERLKREIESQKETGQQGPPHIEYPSELHRIAMSLGVDMRGPEMGGPAGWQESLFNKLIERKTANDLELFRRLHPELFLKERKEGKLTFVSEKREPLTDKEKGQVIRDYAREQTLQQARRSRIIDELHKQMVESSRVSERSPLRRRLNVTDINFKKKTQLGPYVVFNDLEWKNMDFLRGWLADESAGTPTRTNRVILLVNDSTNDAELVSIYRSYPEREIMVYDPSGAPGDKTRRHMKLADLLGDYHVKASMLITDPVRNFHQRWTGTQHKTGVIRFMEEIGWDAAKQAGGDRPFRDLNVAKKVEKQRVATMKHLQRFALTGEQRAAFDRLKKFAEENPESMSKNDRVTLEALYRLDARYEEAREKLAKMQRERRLEDTGEEEILAEKEEKPREMEEDVGEEEGVDVKELAAAQNMAGHLVDFASAVDPDVIERKLSDPGFDPTDIESLPSKLAHDEWGLLNQIFTHTFLSRPMSSIEADALGRAFNEWNIKEPGDLNRLLVAMQRMADQKNPLTGNPRGLVGQYYCIVSALDKMARFFHDKMLSIDPKERRADYFDFCLEKGLPRSVESKRLYYEDLKLSAFEQASHEAFEIAKLSSREKPGQARPKIQYSVAAFREAVLEKFGDTARRDIEQATIQEEYKPGRARAIAEITRRLGGPSALDPEVLAFYRQNISKTVADAAVSRMQALAQAPSALREIGFQRVNIPGGKVPVAPGQAMLPLDWQNIPETAGPAAMEMIRQGAEARFGPKPAPIPDWALLRPEAPEGGPVKEAPLKFVGDPMLYTRRRLKGPPRKYQRTVIPSPREMDPSLVEEIAERKNLEKLKQEAPGMEIESTLEESEWGPSRRAWEEMMEQGRRGPLPERPESEDLPALIAMGEQLFQTGHADPYAARKKIQEGRQFTTQDLALVRFFGRTLQRAADESGKRFGYKSAEYAEDFKWAGEWHEWIQLVPARLAGQHLAMFRGNEDVDLGSVTFVRRTARKFKKSNLTEAEARKAQEVADGVEAAIGAADESKAKTTETITNELQGEEAKLSPTEEKFVNKTMSDLERILAAERMEYEKRHPRGPAMALRGEEGKPKPLASEDLRYLAREAGSLMMKLAREGELSDASWREAMLKDHPEAAGHLAEIEPEAIKFRNEFIDYTLGIDAATRKARKMLTRRKPGVAESIVIVKRALEMDPSGKRVSNAEAFHVWNIIKNKYLIPNKDGIRPDFTEMISDAAMDLGVSSERLYRALATNKTVRKVTKEMYDKLQAERRTLMDAKNWLKNMQYPAWGRALRKVPRAAFAFKVGGHGFVGLITHAGNMVFNPYAWYAYWPAWKTMYMMVFSGRYHYQRMVDLQNSVHYLDWKKAGLQINPYRLSDDFQINDIHDFFKNFTGGRGFDALKVLRYDMAELCWKRTPEKYQTPEMRELWANEVNHATGIVKTALPGVIGEAANWGFFAPKLEMSRWAFIFKDTLTAMSYLGSRNATPVQKFWAMSVMRHRLAMTATFFGLLAANWAFNKRQNSDQEVNLWDPTKSDFWQFKVAGFKVGVVGPLIGIPRLIADWLVTGYGKMTPSMRMEGRYAKFLERTGRYAAGKLSPIAHHITGVIAKQDFMRKPMPWSSDVVSPRLAAQGVTRYTYPEWASTIVAPIPAEEALREVWHDMQVDNVTTEKVIKALTAAGVAAASGARLARDPEAED